MTQMCIRDRCLWHSVRFGVPGMRFQSAPAYRFLTAFSIDRSRPTGKSRGVPVLRLASILTGGGANACAHSERAVSYTHLDVYKRQAPG